MAKLNIWVDNYGDVRVFSEDQALQGVSFDVWKDDDELDGDTQIDWDGDKYRVYSPGGGSVQSNMHIEEYEEEPEEEDKPKFKHHFICPTCHHMWDKESNDPVGQVTSSCPRGECEDSQDLMPYKTDELEDA